MSRLAIVVAVSEYQALPNLPACRCDGVAMAETSGADPTKALSLLERIRQNEGDFCTQEEAGEVLNNLATDLENIKLTDELEPLFRVEVQEKPGVGPLGAAIGNWLSENPDRGYFGKPTRKSEPYTERVPRNLGVLSDFVINPYSNQDDAKFQTVTKYRSVISSYSITTEQPYGHLVIELQPELKAVAPFHCIVAPLLSRTNIIVFWRFISFDYSDWDKPVQKGSSNWTRAESKLKDLDNIAGLVDDIQEGFQAFISKALLEKWPSAVTLGDEDRTVQSEKD